MYWKIERDFNSPRWFNTNYITIYVYTISLLCLIAMLALDPKPIRLRNYSCKFKFHMYFFFYTNPPFFPLWAFTFFFSLLFLNIFPFQNLIHLFHFYFTLWLYWKIQLKSDPGILGELKCPQWPWFYWTNQRFRHNCSFGNFCQWRFFTRTWFQMQKCFSQNKT